MYKNWIYIYTYWQDGKVSKSWQQKKERRQACINLKPVYHVTPISAYHFYAFPT